jgi:hypothetical protein
MCNFTKNYIIYTSCIDPDAHFVLSSVEGSRKQSSGTGPHQRYILLPGYCPHCYLGEGILDKPHNDCSHQTNPKTSAEVEEEGRQVTVDHRFTQASRVSSSRNSTPELSTALTIGSACPNATSENPSLELQHSVVAVAHAKDLCVSMMPTFVPVW